MLMEMLVRRHQISRIGASLHLRICSTNCGGLEHRFYGRARLHGGHFRARVHRTRASVFLRFYEAEVKRCERSQRADKTVSILPSVSAITRLATEKRQREGPAYSNSPVHPPSCPVPIPRSSR